MRRSMLVVPIALSLGIAACGSSQTDDAPVEDLATSETPTLQQAVASLQTADGTPAGSVTATAAEGGGVTIAVNVEGLEPGEHGVHVHMTGSCEPPAFESAGGHWNPADTQHGLENPDGPHAGDMPNLAVSEAGSGSLGYTLQGATFDGLLDADGSAFVVHAMPDDQTTDPSGNSGDRIACGVFSES